MTGLAPSSARDLIVDPRRVCDCGKGVRLRCALGRGGDAPRQARGRRRDARRDPGRCADCSTARIAWRARTRPCPSSVIARQDGWCDAPQDPQLQPSGEAAAIRRAPNRYGARTRSTISSCRSATTTPTSCLAPEAPSSWISPSELQPDNARTKRRRLDGGGSARCSARGGRHIAGHRRRGMTRVSPIRPSDRNMTRKCHKYSTIFTVLNFIDHSIYSEISWIVGTLSCCRKNDILPACF